MAKRLLVEACKVLGLVWCFSAVVSLGVIGHYYLAEPWCWVCDIFLVGAVLVVPACWVVFLADEA